MSRNREFNMTEGRFGGTFIPCGSGVALTRDRYWGEAKYLPEYEQVPLTVECWVKRHKNNGERNLFISSGPKHYRNHWEIYANCGRGELFIYIPGLCKAPVGTGFVLELDEWYYIAMVLD